MARVFKPKTEAIEYTPVADDTLETIVSTKCEVAVPPITIDEVALFNWGTKEPKEVLRALVEQFGVKAADLVAPAKSKLDPARGPGGTPAKLLLPKLVEKNGMAYERVHTLKVKQQKPATAISISELDKWFLPGEEECKVGYALEGLHDRAMKVQMDVYASNYAKTTPTVSGEFISYAYTDIPDIPIIQKELKADAEERTDGTDESWKGESEATEGILKPRTPKKRYINAASAPYTVTVKYYKEDAHKKAILRICSFWPRWTGATGSRTLVDESLKFKWTLKDCPAGMQGQFQITDKTGAVIWRQALPASKCANGEWEHDWSANGKTLVKEADMPYRVQIQVHTNKDTDEGLGLAAMHTDVRILTHPKIGTFAADHEKEPQILPFAAAPIYSFNGTAPADDSPKGRKIRLANAGYHPGPIEDGEGQAPYLMAVKEFQRDHLQPGVNPATRIKADGTIGPATKAAITAQAAGRRALYADNSRADITVDTALNAALNVKATQIVAWIDDRHNHTTVSPAATPNLLPNQDLEDYRGGCVTTGDHKVTKDSTSVPRPWLPIEVEIPIMKKADDLHAADPVAPEVTDVMRAATGPIRVDWTFRDTAPEYKVDTSQYLASRVRSLKYLTKAIDNIKGTHNGKDAFNVTTALGGLRGGAYYQAIFGVDGDSLMPWKAEADGGVSTVCSVAHDDLGQDEAQVFEKRLGKAGVYLRPSIIGGDGYQFCAQVSFRDMPSSATHPNWKVLRNRYEAKILPQAHTAPIRMWRRDSYRAHIQWSPTPHWPAYANANSAFYEPGMVHFVQEGAGTSTRATALYPIGAGVTNWRTVVSSKIIGTMGINAKTDHYRPAAEMTLTDDTIWPWSAAVHLGVQAVPATGTTLANYELVFQNKIRNDTWRAFREPLVIDVIGMLERNQGVLRGHLVGEFKASPEYWKELYYCSVCNTDHILMERAATGGTGIGEPCRVGVCVGVLESSIRQDFKCDQCGFRKNVALPSPIAGTACTAVCTGTFTQDIQLGNWFSRNLGGATSVTTNYSCNKCNRSTSRVEASAAVGAFAGTACGQVCPRHGAMRAVSSTKRVQKIAGPMKDLSLPSWGGPLGGLFLDTKEGPRTYWAHEIGHHKILEHAGDVIIHPNQHDQAANTVDATVQSYSDPKGRLWDRDCIMSYINTETGDDRAYFCGKCLLKLRGWKIEGLADPPGNQTGP